MLLELYIKNIAIIHEIRIPFNKGFSAITGETGAGKSIILGALNLVLGERVKGELLPAEVQKGTIETLFDVSGQTQVQALLLEQGIDLEKDEALILRREILRQGSHRNYVNNRSVPLSFLKELGNRLIDFHGQHEHQSLFHKEEQLYLLDSFSKALKLRETLKKWVGDLKLLKEERDKLKQLELEKKERIEFLSFQINEIASAQLKETEEAELDEERNLLAYSENIREALTDSLNLLSDQDPSAVLNVAEALKQLGGISSVQKVYKDLNERLQAVQIELDDIASEIRNHLESVHSDPQRLADVESRLSLIWRLKQKYGNSLKDVLNFLKTQSEKLNELESAGERLKELEAEIAEKEASLIQEASQLSRLRKKEGAKLEKRVQKELQECGMKNCQFSIRFQQQQITQTGAESVEFLIAPNLGDQPKPLRFIASGGEISRLMLALKAVFSNESSIPTMIFDEIDVNLGGEAAEIVGRKIKQLSVLKQVLVITHLPQVASKADQNYKVEKGDTENKTRTSIRLLNEEEKTYEIARMLRGKKISQLALEHARELIQGT